jgi:hypothetical protein
LFLKAIYKIVVENSKAKPPSPRRRKPPSPRRGNFNTKDRKEKVGFIGFVGLWYAIQNDVKILSQKR